MELMTKTNVGLIGTRKTESFSLFLEIEVGVFLVVFGVV
jgi:hypothetical protein